VNLFRKFAHWFRTPQVSSDVLPQNFVNVQVDAIGVAIANSASPFLPVFLARYQATTFQVGMLTWMPAITGLFLALPLGWFLQRQSKIIPWFSFSRLAVIVCFALTGLVSVLLPEPYWVPATLVIWAIATIPQTMLAICFSVVMNAVSGPTGRFELLSRRWAIFGMTTSITVFFIGQMLDKIISPLNYQLVFLGLSIGGLISFYFSSHIVLKDREITNTSTARFSLIKDMRNSLLLARNNKPFSNFISKRFVFLSGVSMAAPLFPLYFVRTIQAPDSWIAAITTAQTFVMIFGYFFWTQVSRRRESKVVLLWSTLGVGLYPILLSLTNSFILIAILAGISGIFLAGLDLVFFDELLRTVPAEHSATYVSLAQGIQYLSSFFSPLIGTALAIKFGTGPALMVAGCIRLVGFLLFFGTSLQKNR
jgi:Na+/melibiose symporter-like transporter